MAEVTALWELLRQTADPSISDTNFWPDTFEGDSP